MKGLAKPQKKPFRAQVQRCNKCTARKKKKNQFQTLLTTRNHTWPFPKTKEAKESSATGTCPRQLRKNRIFLCREQWKNRLVAVSFHTREESNPLKGEQKNSSFHPDREIPPLAIQWRGIHTYIVARVHLCRERFDPFYLDP